MESSIPNLVQGVGDLLQCNAQCIVHQCNCVTRRPKHLSEAVFKRYPYVDIYSRRDGGLKDHPGTIIVTVNGTPHVYQVGNDWNPIVINLLGQYGPGKSRGANDSREKRYQWFLQGLNQIGQLGNLTNLAFPYQIGCGAAGGNWNRYYAAIKQFALQHSKVQVYIIKLATEK